MELYLFAYPPDANGVPSFYAEGVDDEGDCFDFEAFSPAELIELLKQFGFNCFFRLI
jgi:hypothetical protein